MHAENEHAKGQRNKTLDTRIVSKEVSGTYKSRGCRGWKGRIGFTHAGFAGKGSTGKERSQKSEEEEMKKEEETKPS